MTEEPRETEANLQNLMSLRDRLKDEIEKSQSLLREVESAISKGTKQGQGKRENAKRAESAPSPSGKLSTGIGRLDDLLMGGFQEASNILLNGPPYSSKYLVADSFIVSSLESGIPVLVLSLDRDINSIRESVAAKFGPLENIEASGRLKFIDAYSRNVVMESGDRSAIVIDNVANNTSNFLKSIDSHTAAAKKQYGKYAMVVYSLTGWLTQSDEKSFSKAFQHFSQRRKIEGATSLFLIEDGIFQRSLYESVNYFMDGTIEFRTEGSSEFLRVRGLKEARSRDWVQVLNTDEGFSLGLFELKRIR